MSVLNEKDINQMIIRNNVARLTYNFETLQTVGIMRALAPALEKIYGDDKEGLAHAMNRHLNFCNSHVFGNAFIIGLSAAMEETTPEEEKDNRIISMKSGLMGPMAALGDSMVKYVIVPILGSIGAAMALEGNAFGPIFMFIMYNIVNLGGRVLFVRLGYYKGMDFILKNAKTNMLQRITRMSNVIGCMVVGSMISTTVKASIKYVIAAGGNEIVIQDMIDKVAPNLLGLGITFLIYYLLKKTEGKHAALMIIAIMIISVLCKFAGIL